MQPAVKPICICLTNHYALVYYLTLYHAICVIHHATQYHTAVKRYKGNMWNVNFMRTVWCCASGTNLSDENSKSKDQVPSQFFPSAARAPVEQRQVAFSDEGRATHSWAQSPLFTRHGFVSSGNIKKNCTTITA